MGSKFTTDEMVDYLASNGTPIPRASVGAQLLKLRSLVKMVGEVKVHTRTDRTWAKLGAV